MYALVLNNSIQSVGHLPSAARRVDTGQWVTPPDGQWTDEQAADCGYLRVVDVPRPDDTDTQTRVRSVELVAGVPTVVWTARPWTPEELASQEQNTNRTTIEQRAADALDTNRTIRDTTTTYLDLPSPTNTQIAAQVRTLTQAARVAAAQRQGLIRLLLNQLDATD